MSVYSQFDSDIVKYSTIPSPNNYVKLFKKLNSFIWHLKYSDCIYVISQYMSQLSVELLIAERMLTVQRKTAEFASQLSKNCVRDDHWYIKDDKSSLTWNFKKFKHDNLLLLLLYRPTNWQRITLEAWSFAYNSLI